MPRLWYNTTVHRFIQILLPTLLSAWTVLGAPASDSPAPLRSIAEVRRLPESRLKEQLAVELEGTIVVLFETRPVLRCIIDDGTDRYLFFLPRRNDLRLGDRIRLRGITIVDDLHVTRQDHVRITAFERVGTRPVPPAGTVSIPRVLTGELNFHAVRIQGFVDNVFPDEMNPEWTYLVLSGADRHVYVAVHSTDDWLYRLTDAEAVFTGAILPHYCAERVFIGPHLELWSTNDVRVVTPPPADVFSSPYLEDIYHVNPDEVSRMRGRCVEGAVLASWHGDRFLLREQGGRIVRVRLARGEKPPSVGATVKAGGRPETDLFHLGLAFARWKEVPDRTPGPLKAQDVRAEEILGNGRLATSFYGRLIRVRGVLRNLPAVGNADGRIAIECGDYLVPIDLSAAPGSADGLVLGSELAVTGICLMEAESWTPTNPFPILGGFSVIVRHPQDIAVLSRPSGWTPRRLTIVIGALLFALLLVVLWNRALRHLVERRGHELLRAQISQAESTLRTDERTRLAAELHDFTAQNLTAVSYQISAARAAQERNDPETPDLLKRAAQMLQSCRTELRRCLWDLRNDALDEASFEKAIRKTVLPVAGEATVSVRFVGRRTRLSDATAHAILSICRELVSNAVRHGKARKIRIAGEIEPTGIGFLVRDDGTGFNVANRPGSAEGHFGLDGVQSRIGRLNGRLDISSAPGAGTKATVFLQSQAHS